jgi:hypothetical protein
MSRMALLSTMLVLLLAGSARAAGPGEVFLTGALDMPPGSIAGGNGGNFEGEPTGLDISGDGRYVAFTAAADALSSEAHPDVDNVFRKDRVTGDGDRSPAAQQPRRDPPAQRGPRSGRMRIG